MPRWKALPEELDPQIREFTSQLRRLVDRGGLSVNAVADRTGYSKTSWERYLNGRLLAPRGAVVALAEATGTPQHHLITMWELAERAWSRAEMRHDMTMEAIRISQARAALGELGTTGPDARGRGRSARPGSDARVPAGGADAPPRDTRSGEAHPGDAYAEDPYTKALHGQAPYGGDAHGNGPHSNGPRGGGASGLLDEDTRQLIVPTQRAAAPHPARNTAAGSAGPASGSGTGPGPGSGTAGPGGRRTWPMLVVGAVGALVVVVGAVLLAPGGDEPAKASPSPSATPSTAASELPVGVECNGADCAGQDPEAMGCGGEFARTVASAVVGAGKLEVRYSEVCSAAWARLTEAAVGDTVRITAGEGAQDGEVMGDTDAYTPMVAVRKADDAKACATLTSGTRGCTDPEE
ncbi:DUF2690 domain-containing protein [Streptomyces sp. NPDC049916]|uniref:helix-turn-helix domain-containing protein n=1 Tax=Streptomyces sp. NPDC049916 TaxID=3155156 RepID=UPI003418F702